MIICNKCGREIKIVNDIPREDFLEVSKQWGYFSKKDGKNYKFFMCENCVDELAATFKVPVEVTDNTELV